MFVDKKYVREPVTKEKILEFFGATELFEKPVECSVQWATRKRAEKYLRQHGYEHLVTEGDTK